MQKETIMLQKDFSEILLEKLEDMGMVDSSAIHDRKQYLSSLQNSFDLLQDGSPLMELLKRLESSKMNWFKAAVMRLRDYSDGEVWSDGEQILCRTESEADAVADFIWSLYSADGQEVTILTGYYDPEEDERNGEEDRYTGWWYVILD